MFSDADLTPYAVEFIDPARDDRWDRFVERHRLGWVTHLSGWHTALEETFPHMKGQCIVLVDRVGNIAAGLPIFEVNSWLTGRRLVSIPFATLADPLVDSAGQLQILARSALHLSRSVNARYVEIRAAHGETLEGTELLSLRTFHKLHYLNLDRDIVEIWGSFHRSCVRQRIRRALSNEVTLRVGEALEDLKVLYQLYLKTRKRLGLPPQPYPFFTALWQKLYLQNRIELLIAEFRNRPVAAMLLFKFKERVSAEVAVMDSGAHDISPIHFLFWEAIKRSAEEGYSVFDFGRTSPLDRSLFQFKNRWGTSVTELPVFYCSRYYLPTGGVREKSPWLKSLRSMCRYMPNRAFRGVGRLCYRHMS